MNTVRPLFFACILVLSSALTGRAQSPSFYYQKLGSEEGLNNANIFSIQQHPDGLLYFTTQNGIYEYDGYLFRSVLIDSLRNNSLLNASFKNRDVLGLSVRGEGIAEYRLRDKHFEFTAGARFANNADQLLFEGDFIYALTSGIKLYCIDRRSGQLIPDPVRAKDRMNQAFCLYRSQSGRIFLGRSDGLYEVKDGQQRKLPVQKKFSVYSISEDPQGNLLLGSDAKILLWRENRIVSELDAVYEKKSETFLLGGERSVDKLLCDDFGRIWFTSFPGENLYLLQNGKVYDVFELLGIAPSLINCLYRSRDNHIWVGTYNEGVYMIQNSVFNSVQFQYKGKTLSVNQVLLKDNLLVAATSNGLFGMNLSSNNTRILSAPDELFMEPISGIVNRNGTIYYCKRSQFNTSPALFFDSKHSYKLKPVIARCFYPLSEAQSLVADWNANVLRCNADGSKCLDTLISFSDYRISVNALLLYRDQLYVASSNGLYAYDFKTRKYRHLVRESLNFTINDLALINGRLLVAHEAGITDFEKDSLIRFAGPFPLNSVKKIRWYGNKLWLATLEGIYVCDSLLHPVQLITKSNGLLSNSVNDLYIDSDRLGIATVRGIASMPLQALENLSKPPAAVLLRSIRCNDKPLDELSGLYRLEADQDQIMVEFSSPLFAKPNRQYYRYRIDEGEWREFSDQKLDLSLPGGKHRVEIQASTDKLHWSVSRLLTFRKEEKLSENQGLFWFLSLAILLLAAAVVYLWTRRIKAKARKRLEQEQQINGLKHQAMNALLSPHFIFNSLTSIQNYINTNNSLRASEYLAKFSRLIRMIIEKAAQREILLHDELTRLTYYLELEKERFKNRFEYSIEIDEQINTEEVMIPNMILQPFIENSILHGILPKQSNGHLHISFKKIKTSRLLICIEDDGIGLNKASAQAKAGHKSLAVGTIKTILDINSRLSGKKQSLSILDRSERSPDLQGTRIEIELEL